MNLTNPYKSIRKESPQDSHRLNLDVSRRDIFALKMVLMDHGAITSLFNSLLYHYARHIESHQLSVGDATAFLSRCTSVFPFNEGPLNDVSPGTIAVRPTGAGEVLCKHHDSSGVPPSTQPKGKGGKKQRTKRTTGVTT